jgi:hypothetical protein
VLLVVKARISRSIDGKGNVEMVRTRSKDGFGKKAKIGTGGRQDQKEEEEEVDLD